MLSTIQRAAVTAAPGLCKQARERFAAGDRLAAQALLLAAAEAEPAAPEPLLLLGDLLLAERQAERAEAYFQAACQAAPDDPTAWSALACYYHGVDLPRAAGRVARLLAERWPERPEYAGLADELEHLYPSPTVVVMIRARDHAATLPLVLEALAAQSYPIAGVVVIDDGSTDETAATARSLGLPVLRHERPRGWPTCRLAAAQAAESELLAWLDGDCLPEPHWLEHLVQFLLGPTLTGRPASPSRPQLVAVSGDVVDEGTEGTAGLWLARHHAGSPGPGYADIIPWLGTASGVMIRRAALVEPAPELECLDSDGGLADHLRSRGCRVAYTARSVCRRQRVASLQSALDAGAAHRSPYAVDHPYRQFGGASLDELAAWLPDAVALYGVHLGIDRLFGAAELAYLTFVSLPWRVFRALQRLASVAPAAARERIEHTHTAAFLLLCSLLAKTDGVAVLERLVDDLEPCRPRDPMLAGLCGRDGVAAMLASDQGGGGPDPLMALPALDGPAVNRVLETVGQAWLCADAEAWRAVAEAAARPDDPQPGPRLLVARPESKAGESAPELDAEPFAAAGWAVQVMDSRTAAAGERDALARAAAWRPEVVLVVAADAATELDWSLRLREQLPEARIGLVGPPSGLPEPQADFRLDPPTPDSLAAALG